MKRLLAVLMIGLMLSVTGCNTDPKDKAQPVNRSQPKANRVTAKTPPKVIDFREKNLVLYEGSRGERLKLSPDGTKLAFAAVNKNDQGVESWMLLVDMQSGDTKTFDAVGRILDWTKDGKRLLYIDDVQSSIGLLDVVSGEKTIIEKNRTFCAALSADGKSVAYTVMGTIFSWDKSPRPASEQGLWVYDIASQTKKKLTNNPADWYPVWYPDGKKLFYFCDTGKQLTDGAGHLEGMAVIPVDGGTPEIVSTEQGKFRKAQWLTPGKSLYVNAGWDDGFYHGVLDLEHDPTFVL